MTERVVGDEIREVAWGPIIQGLVGHGDIFGLLPLKSLESFEQKSDLVRLHKKIFLAIV